MKIYLLRHGETEWYKDGRLQGHTDIPLNKSGIVQIQIAGEYLRQIGIEIDVIISSPLSRTKKSAEIVAGILDYKKDIIVEQGFIERSFGLAEGLTKAERSEMFLDKRYPGIEPVEALCKRAQATIMKYVELYFQKTILVVAHGSILKALISSVSDGKFSYNEGWEVFGTGELCLLEYDGKSFVIVSQKINPTTEIHLLLRKYLDTEIVKSLEKYHVFDILI